MGGFDSAFTFLMSNEGTGLLDDPKTGEYSRYGITLKTAAALGLCAPDGKAFILNLTEDRAKDFYLDHFWKPLQLDKLHVEIGTKLLDMAVNMGQQRAIMIAQQECRGMGGVLAIDGVMGYHTLICLSGADTHEMLLALRAGSLQFYRELVEKDPARYDKYWETWKARAEK